MKKRRDSLSIKLSEVLPRSKAVKAEKPKAGSLPERYAIERLSKSEQLLALRETWETLTANISDCSFFLTWTWTHTWWLNLRADNELWLLTAKNRKGNLVGLVPLMCGRLQVGPIALKCLQFIGSGLARPVHLDILALDEDRELLAAAFLRYLFAHGREWDLLDLQGLRANSALFEQMGDMGRHVLVRAPEKCSFTSLPDSWETFQHKHLKPKLRKTIRYYRRRLEKDFPGRVIFQPLVSEPELPQALDFLIRNSLRQSDRKGMVSCFANDHFCKFYREMVRTAFQNDFLRFYQLKVDERIIAIQHCFFLKEKFYGYQTAFDPDWQKYSPGQQLLAFLFQEAIREKAQEIDMSHGEGDYKTSWANGERFDWQLLYAHRLRARLWLSGIRTFDRLVTGSRKLLSHRMRRGINRFLKMKGVEIHS